MQEMNADNVPKCATQGPQVPFNSWWASTDMCKDNKTKDELVPKQQPRALKRGNRYFVLNPDVLGQNGTASGVLDLKPYLSKYAYSIVLEVLATNAINGTTKAWGRGRRQ